MKDETAIKVQIDILQQKYFEERDQYHRLHYMDMQSGEGNQCRERMDKLDGKITALKWVLGGY